MNARRQIAQALSELDQLDRKALALHWRETFSSDPPPISEDLLARALAHRWQEQTQGGLPTRVQATLKRQGPSLSKIKPGVTSVTPLPGALLVRSWQGRTYTVTVEEDGFKMDGRGYSSLSQLATEITGTKWSGPRFFGLKGEATTRG